MSETVNFESQSNMELTASECELGTPGRPDEDSVAAVTAEPDWETLKRGLYWCLWLGGLYCGVMVVVAYWAFTQLVRGVFELATFLLTQGGFLA